MKNGLCIKHFPLTEKKMTHFPMQSMQWVVITVGWLIKEDTGLKLTTERFWTLNPLKLELPENKQEESSFLYC